MSRRTRNTKFHKMHPITEAQRAASRANGAKSHGPVTAEGRDRSSINAIRHGLNARPGILSIESTQAYDDLRDQYYLQFQPPNRYVAHLIEDLVQVHWQLRRLRDLDAGYLELEAKRPGICDQFHDPAPPLFLAMAFQNLAEDTNLMATLDRKLNSYTRQFRTLIRLITDLCANQPPVRLAVEEEPDPPRIEKVQNEPKPIPISIQTKGLSDSSPPVPKCA
jgi:hypothetical protein